MRLHSLALALALALAAGAAAACGAPPLPCGSNAGSTTVPGVTISLDTETCSVPAGSATTFDYTTKITAPLTFMTAPHAGCDPTLDDPKSFTATEIIGGGSAVYCPTCDLGTCPEDPGEMITIPPGTYTGSLDWPGVQWYGPGEGGNNPLGAPFPAGPATVHVVFDIPGGKIDAQLPIIIE